MRKPESPISYWGWRILIGFVIVILFSIVKYVESIC
jgi:hypothetical protein